jgi:hypothetical protein
MIGMIRPLLLAFLLVALFCPWGNAQTINAASCNTSDVQTAFNKVNASTTIVSIPAGTCDWTTQVTLTVPSGSTKLTIQGQGNTTGSDSLGNPTGYNDQTIIVDEYLSSTADLVITTGGTSSFLRVTGLTFQGGNIQSTRNTKYNGFVVIQGSSQNVRFDHNHLNFTPYSPTNPSSGLEFFGLVYGVMDHNFTQMPVQNTSFRAYNSVDSYGDTAWSQPTAWGTSQALYIENNTINGGAVDDCQYGGRFVARYNTINVNSTLSGYVLGHGTGQSGTGGIGRFRSCRLMEIYHNNFNNPYPSTYSQYGAEEFQAGTGVSWANTVSTGYEYVFTTFVGRNLASGHPQEPPPRGFGYCGNTSSGADSPWDQNSNATTGYACMDVVGRGQGDLLNGKPFPNVLNTVSGAESWPRQRLEPVYEWLDTCAGCVALTFSQEGTQVVANQDYFPYNTSFNGTSGTGAGLLSARPTTCTTNAVAYPAGNSPGVGYWATDTNTLYVCTATNTWGTYYQPYTYPHPLTQGGDTSSAPSAPTGLAATVQ